MKRKYTLERGDTLYSIANKNNMNLLDLLALNQQIENPDVVQTGQEIIIESLPKVKEKERLNFITDEMSGTGIPIKDQIGFEVRKNLYNKGLKMSAEADEFLELGPMTGTSIPAKDIIKYDLKRMGKNLQKQMGSLLMRPQEKFTEKAKEQKRLDFKNYEIKKGDTLSSIAAKNKLNIDQLYLANVETLDSPDKINIGQTIRIPQFGIQQAEDFKERQNLPVEQPRERFLPSNVRQLLSDINPINRIRRKNNIAMEDFTEKHLTPDEYKTAQMIAKEVITNGSLGYQDTEGNIRNRGDKNIISYNDFKTSENPFDDVGGGSPTGIQKAIDKFQDPAFALKTLIGSAQIIENDKGETIIIYRYNFNEEDPNSFRDYAQKLARVINDPIYGSFREAGSLLGSNKGEGSFIRINLGVL